MLNIEALKYLLRYIAVACFLVTSVFLATPIMAASSVTFSWLANPPEENVIGYRLYYGSQSRYNSDGSYKEDFSYPQYIDFMDQVRCFGTDYSSCEPLSSQDLQCEELYSETPRCTVYGLNGTLYFAMTACTNTAESGFTAELKSATPQQLQSIVQIIDLLLLSD